MAQAKAATPSIIETIDRMVREGEGEDKIMSTLRDLGISQDNARRLLILGQADVFSLLKGEIRRTLRDELEHEAPEIKKTAQEETSRALDEGRQQLSKAMVAELKEYEKSLASQNKALQQELDAKIQKLEDMEQKTRTGMSEQARVLQEQIVENIKEYEKNLNSQNKAFQEQLLGKILKGAELPEKARTELLSQGKLTQEQTSAGFKEYQAGLSRQYKAFQDNITQKVERMNELEEKSLKRLNQMGDEMKKVESDMGEIGIKGVGTRNRMISYAVIGLGLLFGAATLYVLYTNIQSEFTTQNIIIMTVMSIITVTLLVVGTLI